MLSEISLGSLTGEVINVNIDKRILKRLEELQLLDPNKQNTLYDLIDTYIRDAKARLAYQ